MTAQQPAPTSSFLYPDSPAYDPGPLAQAQQQQGHEAPTAQPVASASFLYPDNPEYAEAPPSLPNLDSGEQTTRIAIASPQFTAAQSPTHEMVGAAGQPIAATIPTAGDGSTINVQLDACVSPILPVDGNSPADADGWGAIAFAVDPADAFARALPSGTRVTITPRWSTSDARTVAAGRAHAIVYLRAVTVKD